MEELDLRILELLTADGRMSYTDIGRATGLSTSAAQQRVRRLEQRGVITGYRAQVDQAALGTLLTAFVDITPFDPAQPDDAPERLEPLHEVVSCYSVAGQSSHLLKVEVTGPEHLERLLADIRSAAHVSTRTTLVLSVPFADRPNIHPGTERD